MTKMIQKYNVYYDGWQIEVEASSIKQARHRAYIKFSETYHARYGEFMSGIESVEFVV